MEKRDFLNNIKDKLKQAHLPEAEIERPAPPEPVAGEASDMLPRFKKELEMVNGRFVLADSPEACLNAIVAVFEEYEAFRYIGWDEAELPIDGVHAYLDTLRINRLRTNLPHRVEDRSHTQAALDEAVIGITGCSAGLADTGSLVVTAGAGRGRMSSLLPLVHIAIIRKDQLYPTLAHFVQANPDIHRSTSNLTIITGPSRTADIEQTLTLGVHGPGVLVVVCLDEGE